MKNRLKFYEMLEERVENGEDVVLTCSSNGIYAIVDNSVGNCSTIIEYKKYNDDLIITVLPNNLYKYLERNNNVDKSFS